MIDCADINYTYNCVLTESAGYYDVQVQRRHKKVHNVLEDIRYVTFK